MENRSSFLSNASPPKRRHAACTCAQKSPLLMQNPSLLIQNPSLLIQNSSFLMQNSWFLMQNSWILPINPVLLAIHGATGAKLITCVQAWQYHYREHASKCSSVAIPLSWARKQAIHAQVSRRRSCQISFVNHNEHLSPIRVRPNLTCHSCVLNVSSKSLQNLFKICPYKMTLKSHGIMAGWGLHEIDNIRVYPAEVPACFAFFNQKVIVFQHKNIVFRSNLIVFQLVFAFFNRVGLWVAPIKSSFSIEGSSFSIEESSKYLHFMLKAHAVPTPSQCCVHKRSVRDLLGKELATEHVRSLPWESHCGGGGWDCLWCCQVADVVGSEVLDALEHSVMEVWRPRHRNGIHLIEVGCYGRHAARERG